MLYYMISCTMHHMISHIMYHMSCRVHTIIWLIFVRKIFLYNQFHTKIVCTKIFIFQSQHILLPNDAIRLFQYLLPCIAVPFIYVLGQRRLYGYLHGSYGTSQTRELSKVLFLSSDVFLL